ncbi:endo alpha-1,4 polygalactosaminidase [Geodermatophilus sp. SYSU D00703]
MPAVAALAVLLSGCGSDDAPSAPSPAQPTLAALPAGARVDYQLGGAYAPAPGAAGVVRDRTDAPAPGLWSACYVNAFQTQPGADDWPEELLLHDTSGRRMEDPDWPGEFLLDVSTDQRRAEVLAVVGPWIDGCAASGFDAVEPDNLDSWTRSDGLLTAADAASTAETLVDRAHAVGLAIAQKNAPELAGEDLGFDFAVVEDCGAYDECTVYTDAFGSVLDVEYTADGFQRACTLGGLSVQRRDLDLTVPGDPAYVAEWCPAR